MDGRRVALGVGVFGLVFLLVVAVETLLLSRRPAVVYPVAVVVATGFGLLAYLRARG